MHGFRVNGARSLKTDVGTNKYFSNNSTFGGDLLQLLPRLRKMDVQKVL